MGAPAEDPVVKESPTRVVLATGNPGKAREFQALLDDTVELVLQTDLGVESAAETGSTFLENALLKARHAAACTGLPALADDSGIAVDALDGKPGVHSARYAGDDADDQANLDKLLLNMREVPAEQRSARFCCALVLLRHAEDPEPLIIETAWEGRIAEQPQGNGGFGYDPVFIVPETGVTSAQLEPAHKNRISHRGQAVAALAVKLPGFLSG